MKSLKDKVVVVTGAGSGMGREISLLCASRGAIVALADYNEASAAETASMIKTQGGHSSVHLVDVSKREDVVALAAAVIKTHGRVDVLFNNAGIIPRFVSFADTGYDVFERMLAVNLWGVIACTKEFLPHLLKQRRPLWLTPQAQRAWSPIWDYPPMQQRSLLSAALPKPFEWNISGQD